MSIDQKGYSHPRNVVAAKRLKLKNIVALTFEYRTRTNKGRGLYSKNIFSLILAANNRERLLFEKYFSQQSKTQLP